jgi:hypothetical protein
MPLMGLLELFEPDQLANSPGIQEGINQLQVPLQQPISLGN